MAKYLDGTGLNVLWTKIKSMFYQKSETYSKTEVNSLIPDAYTKTQSDSRYALASALSNYYDKYTSDSKYALITALQNYYKKTETYSRTEIDTKIENASGGSIDAYTKSESDNRYYQKSEVYTKTETDNKYQTKGTYASILSTYSATISSASYLPSISIGQIKSFNVKGTSNKPTLRLPSGGTYLIAICSLSSDSSFFLSGATTKIGVQSGGTSLMDASNTTSLQGFYYRIS